MRICLSSLYIAREIRMHILNSLYIAQCINPLIAAINRVSRISNRIGQQHITRCIHRPVEGISATGNDISIIARSPVTRIIARPSNQRVITSPPPATNRYRPNL